MSGKNFNTFGEHAPNVFTQMSNDEDNQVKGIPKRSTIEPAYEVIKALNIEPQR